MNIGVNTSLVQLVVSEPMCSTRLPAFTYSDVPSIMFQIRSKEPSDADQFDVGG